MNLRFVFELFVDDQRAIVEIKTFKRIGNLLIQNLLIKSRFIRYRKINDEIRRIEPFLKMILLVNGSIKGPRYDPIRYLRMLTAAGWDVYPANILFDGNAIRRIFENA